MNNERSQITHLADKGIPRFPVKLLNSRFHLVNRNALPQDPLTRNTTQTHSLRRLFSPAELVVTHNIECRALTPIHSYS